MGDMEMDLILGASSSEAILTLTNRKTDYVFLEALPHRRKAKPIARAVNSRLGLPQAAWPASLDHYGQWPGV